MHQNVGVYVCDQMVNMIFVLFNNILPAGGWGGKSNSLFSFFTTSGVKQNKIILFKILLIKQ